MSCKVLVTGGEGILGSYLHEAFDTIVTGIDLLDVRDRTQVFDVIEKVRPGLVLHLAAETDVDLCERDPDHAYKTNTIGTLNVALACQWFDVDMVYISTVGVFGGEDKAGAYTEFDAPSPVSVYGKSKLEGERIVKALLSQFYVVRAGWMMGGGRTKDHKFVGKIGRLALECDTLNIVGDKFGSPTYARQFVQNLRVLVDSRYYGTYHMVNTGMCSRYEMALGIVQTLGLKTVLVEVNSAHFPLAAPRPRNEAAQNYKLELLGLNRMSRWDVALRQYLREEWGAE